MKHFSRWLLVGILVVGLAAGSYLWWQSRQNMPPLAEPTADATAPAEAAPATAPELAVPATPPILHPIEADQLPTEKPGTPPALADSDRLVKDALIDAIGRRGVLSFLNLDSVVRRVVATVDNMTRGHAPANMWPVVPTPGRFLTLERGDGTYLADGNAERYTPFVRFATAVDTGKIIALYRQLYPLFQQAYEELGYPGKYFNDRLVGVIDQLLQTPELNEPVKLTLTQVQGPIPATRPWVRYEFADPSLQSRPAGQKILLRMGTANAGLLKNKLSEIREHIATRPR
jgi:hypothetical protein